MGSVSRRLMIAGGAAIPFAQWFGGQAWAQGVSIRRDLSTPGGQADLQKYAKAVKILTALPESDPRGWMFQWYIHAVRGDRTKAAELARVYPAPSPQRQLAQDSWSTCQAHGPGTVEDYFLPWHRMYVFFIESIIKKTLNDPTFAMPYWRYTQPAQRALPAAFRQPGSPTLGTLYRPNRNSWTNAGSPIDQGVVPSPLNTSSLLQKSYRPASGDQGFCMGIDFNLHGTVHVQTGNGVGMGSVAWAAYDPIFWMHHSNIDRMWGSWNKNGGCNPSDAGWLNKTFIFPDANGQKIIAKVGDFKALAPLKYTYDLFEPGPKIGVCLNRVFKLAQLPHIALAERPFPIDPLGPVAIKLSAPRENVPKANLKLLQTAGAARPRLVISALQAQIQPEVLFRVEIQANEKARPVTVGFLNFFDAVASEHADHAGMDQGGDAPSDKFFSFDIGDAVRGLTSEPIVTLTPVGKGATDSKPVVGSVRVIQG
ncbi:tyrosinase family protein [Caulobacter sp. AP07]|uniref:tyrosinase family protein n=1 Tax=Caulobacter sp. AP07 TaxID=1144304 RepID=UPI000271FCAC|nr:tyrosinase family protein [Caulobacter sp. AP07]EJL30372.1 tyrosinase family protein [Caulobacter sp. AP07]